MKIVSVGKQAISLVVLLLWFVLNHQAQAHIMPTEAALQCELKFIPAQPQSAEILVSMTLHNHRDTDMSLLTWYTPLEGFLSDLFIITNDQGEQIKYQGRMVKRLAPSSEDYILLLANQSISVTLNLRQGYLLAPGNYQVQMRRQAFQEQAEQAPLKTSACLPITIIVQSE